MRMIIFGYDLLILKRDGWRKFETPKKKGIFEEKKVTFFEFKHILPK